ncbi:MAG: M20/M25/M40 family metallo-hydrolase [Caldilineaceae bacterium]|nr:M20/M25/M40 family metallo-hydrolase [Caldilineaceae bacterium]
MPLATNHPLLTDNPSLAIFTELLSVPSPSSYEQQVAAIVRRRLDDLGLTHETDGAGNITVHLPGQEPERPLLCLASHMDEIGFVVTSIESDGTLRVMRSGGLYPWKHGEGPVEVLGDQSSIVGMLSMGSTHTATGNKALEWSDVKVITGRTPAELAEAGIRPGSPGVPTRDVVGPLIFGSAADPLVGAWTFDDRMGVAMLLRILTILKERGLQPLRPTLIAFTVCEEVGGLGAKVVAAREQPETFIAVDGSPIPPGSPLAIDGRPGIWSKDRLAPYDVSLLRDLCAASERVGTALQPVAYDSAASDASLVFAAGLTQRIACVGHVRENSHGYEVARVSVFENSVKTLVEFVTSWQ